MNPHFKENRGHLILCGGLSIICLASFCSVAFYFGLKPVNQGINGDVVKTEIVITRGQGLKEIAVALAQAGLIRSVTAFKLYVIFSGQVRHLKPGFFQISPSLDVPEITKLLLKTSNEEVTVSIPEGTTVAEINRILTAKHVLPSDSLVNFKFSGGVLAKRFSFLRDIDNLEGFLYPDTYRFKINSSVEEVTEKFFNNFQKKIWPLIGEKTNWREVLVLASILEKEVLTFEERRLVAGILYKRLKVKMPLQVDATIAYAKCQGNLYTCVQRQVTKDDLKTDSPYNTYLHGGLPPTPIANMSDATVQAALQPQTSEYWYYLSAYKTKETIFSKDLEEHNYNRQKYLNL